MKALRRSIKGEKESKNINIVPKAAVAIVPPKKVIRALYDYEARNEQELGFSRGDFFHVIGRENDQDWYEACNPALPDARGLVPVAFFQALGRTERDSAQSEPGKTPMSAKTPDHDSGYSESSAMHSASSGPQHYGNQPMAGPGAAAQRNSKGAPGGGKSGAMVYGIVMYDFAAERADELEAKAGEAIIVIAQSNPEWFVAKPIGRLGGPGLIPVSFIEIRDMASGKAIENPQEAIRKAGVPRVEEWKKMAADYKNSSITLGKFEVGGSNPGIEQGMEQMSLQQGRASGQSGTFANQGRSSQTQAQTQSFASKSVTQIPAPISARIPRYCYAEEKYWFVIRATLENGTHWELSRYYEDFYDFQIALLTEFPSEAGNAGSQKRTLPYMPGPVSYVTDAITEGRLHNLDQYVKNLLGQPQYISRCSLVKQFFAPREGDYEIDANDNGDEYRLSEGSQQSSVADPDSRQSSRNNLSGGDGYDPRGMNNGLQYGHQTPSQSQTTLASAQQQQGAATMKIKMYYNSDLIALRVPNDITFEQLHDKIRDRLKISDADRLELFYKDEQTGDKPSLLSTNDLDVALQRNEKLLLFVEVV